MINLEVFAKDPRTHTLLNQGVAKVTGGQSTAELATLRYEIENFVCDGQYATGLSRILSTYLGHLDKSEQPGVWVSGFFGSGKSHLVKMLQNLWIDYEFPDKAKARGLAKLSSAVKDALKELTTVAKRLGGLHAIAGTLGAGGGVSLRLELLGLVCKSVELPEHHSRASFILWLRDEKLEDSVRKFIKAAGGDFDKELANLFVSDLIAKAILDARPDFANKTADVRLLLQKQFSVVADLSIDETIAAIRRAIGKNGKMPCTLIALDEVQQYINADPGRSKAVQDLQEQCCSRLGSNVLFVATGQNALSAVPLLQKLLGRFPVTIELQDTDVEQVTREVVLKKKPSAEPGLSKLLDDHSGEIERQLANTKIAFSVRDRGLLVQDYPILPVRRRFWERVLRAVDEAGTTAQLRNQLWVVYDAVRKTANLPLGRVVSGAHVYDSSIHGTMLRSGVLLQEISETIAKQKKEVDGDLRYEICALIFLIGRLPQEGPADAGIRADAETLADLLVTDLTQSSAALRKQVPELLDKLVAAGAIMKIETEYRMQTREGAEWNQTYLTAKNRLLNDAGKLASERSQLLKSQYSELFQRFKLPHGSSKEPRKIALHFGDTPPTTDGETIPVWVRDGWEVEEHTVLNDARAAGDTAALVFGFIPRKHADELKTAIASYYAATTTLQAKGTPASKEGIEARRSMDTQQVQARQTRDNVVTDILNETAIYVAGGDLVSGMLVENKVHEAAKACLDRLFPLFHLADYPAADWQKVREQAAKGDGDALARVGYKGDPESHPVCKAVLDFVGSGKKGTDIRRQFEGPRYGWPQDAIDAALVVLFQLGAIQARAGSEPIAKGKLDQRSIAAAEFRVENQKLTAEEIRAVRTLFKASGLQTQPGQESADVGKFLDKLGKLAESAGGEPPLPKVPDTKHLNELAARVGNDQLKAIHDIRERLAREIAEWQKRGDLISHRAPRWQQLTALLSFAGDLPVDGAVRPEVAAIEQHRSILADPDPVPGLADKVTSALRTALNEAHSKLKAEHETRWAALEVMPTWQQLKAEQRHQLLSQAGVRELPGCAVGTPDDVLATLRQTKLSELHARCDALPTRFNNALAAAAKLLEPKAQAVRLPSGTIRTEDELRAWLAEVEAAIRARLSEGPVIV